MMIKAMGSTSKNWLISLCVFCVGPFLMFGQNEPVTSTETNSSINKTAISNPEQHLGADQAIEKAQDTLNPSLKNNLEAAEIERAWYALLSDTYRFEEQQQAINTQWDSIPLHDSLWSTETFKSRLEALDQKTPFHITYNTSLEQIVRNYLKNRRPQLERLMGLSHYYFPMFEEVFAQYGLPLEMKYLAIVESALVPTATSRVGARGLWQFMSFLPRETAGYLPAFYATMYIFEYASDYGLTQTNTQPHYITTDTIQIKQTIALSHVAQLTQTPQETIEFLNPEYTLGLIPYIEDRPYFLRMPVSDLGLIVENQDSLYGLARADFAQREKPLPELVDQNNRIRYRVKSGDYLGKIANKYGVSVAQIKQWNGLKSTQLRIGQRLTIIPKRIPVNETTSTSRTKNSNKDVYVVQRGDSLWGIAQKFPGITLEDLKKWNDISGSEIKPGMALSLKPRS
ncbi:MAG: LysM peptidoglycan-binding domain-containing protein [Flavobacteriaceae bacterium]|nr:LysM peptidoglycan-binding domain-containing protein [Flavobacteriaceae bacterium]